jgi:predicted metal-dependent hydrolase
MPSSTEHSCPDYRIRVSRRARRVSIRVSPLGEVEVVIPPGFDRSIVPELIAHRQTWLDQTRARMSQRIQAQPETHGLKPLRVELLAIGESWQVDYAIGLRSSLLESRPVCRLTLASDSPAQHTARHLRDWLQKRAREILPDWLRQTAAELELPCKRITVRGQKTRWGSCTAQHHISLNRSLLLLPAETVRYLFIHELCHTRHLNHSAHFWQEVARHAPNFKTQEGQLRDAARTLPLWVHA